MAAKSKATESDSPVAAEEQLAQREGEPVGADGKTLEDRAEEQKAEQADELKAGKQGVTAEEKAYIKEVAEAPAGPRAGHGVNAPTVNGKMDQMSRRNVGDALEGHFVTIDASVDGVEEAYRDARLIRDENDERGEYKHQGYYGVYLQPAALDQKTGIPVTAVVRLRDDTNALVRVPYESLSPADPRGR